MHVRLIGGDAYTDPIWLVRYQANYPTDLPAYQVQPVDHCCYNQFSFSLVTHITVQNVPDPMMSHYVIPCRSLTITLCIVVYKWSVLVHIP